MLVSATIEIILERAAPQLSFSLSYPLLIPVFFGIWWKRRPRPRALVELLWVVGSALIVCAVVVIQFFRIRNIPPARVPPLASSTSSITGW
jgi:drug/metabolite transporter (DMT)-like permease